MKKRLFKRIFWAGMMAMLIIFACASCEPSRNYNQNTMHTVTSFGFTEDGKARVSVDYTGYHDTTGADIDVTIEKQGFLFFWEKVVTKSYHADGESYHNEYFYDIDEDGTYRCTVVYTVFGEGENDVITFKDTKDYRAGDEIIETTDTSTAQTTTTETTKAESSSVIQIPEIPKMTAAEFAEKLVNILEKQDDSNTEFHTWKTVTIDGVTYQSNILTSVQSDFRDNASPLYSYFSTASSQTEDFENYYIFIDDTVYISRNGERLQKPFSAEDFMEKVPRHALTLLFGNRLYDEISWSHIEMNEDGTVTASTNFGFSIYKENLIDLIEFLTNDDVSEHEPRNYDMVDIAITLDADGNLHSYVIEFSCEIMQNGTFIPVTYRMQGEEKEMGLENFRKNLLYQTEPYVYLTKEEKQNQSTEKPEEAEKPQETVSREEFLQLFREASAKLDHERYEIQISANSRLHMSLISIDIPLNMHIKMDCGNRDYPLYSQERNTKVAGVSVHSEIYYRDDRLYTSSEGENYMVMMLSDYFLEDYEAEWIFFDESMTENATFRKNEDGSLTASARISGYASKILQLIAATYGDDFSYDQPILSYESPVTLTIDTQGNIRSFTLGTRVSVIDDRDGSQYSVSYTFEIVPKAMGDTVDISFPDDLDTYEDITEEYYRNYQP
ncbi:MAG: hypothetical protein IJ489_03230 [Clostridia bacterium]|nr:hypothetical protein [Clostridia bacterium]